MTSIYTDLNTALFSALTGTSAAATALVGALGGSAVYYMQPPDDGTKPQVNPPYVIWSYQSDIQENVTNSPLHAAIAYVRCYDTKSDRAGTIDGLIDACLDKKTLTVGNSWVNVWSAREEALSIVENPPSQQPIYNVGAFYRIRLDK